MAQTSEIQKDIHRDGSEESGSALSAFIANPILRRELSTRLRSPKALLAIALVAIISCGLVLMRWPSEATIDLVSQGAVQVFQPVSYAIAIAIMMLIPAFPATAIVSERKRGTLTLLLNSPTKPLSIYLGKLFANVLLGILIFSVSLPAIFACYAMGGISIAGNIVPLVLIFLGMAFHFYFFKNLFNFSSGSNDESSSCDSHVFFSIHGFFLPNTVGFANFSILV
jgi:ABC-type transport system involved in multi-copper enzyme maturation permease subunit